jgi:hypothetical protein
MARLQFHPLETEQAHAFLARGADQVELGHIGARAPAGVGDAEGGSDRVTTLNLETAVVEDGVALAVPEGVQRLLPLLGEPPVTDLGAFGVRDGDRVPQGVPRPGRSGRGVWVRSAGKVTGSRPDGFTAPVRISAMAWPPAWPGYHASTIARTRSRQGIITGLPVSSTTIVLGFAAATASITAS